MQNEEGKYRALNFDLKLKLLRNHYPKKNILNAYKDIASFMKKNDFSHRQWSGYRSNSKLTDSQVCVLMLDMRTQLHWIDKCSTRIDVTNIEKTYDIKDFFYKYDNDSKNKNINQLFEESEIKEFNTLHENVKSLEVRIKEAERTPKVMNRNRSVSFKKEIDVR